MIKKLSVLYMPFLCRGIIYSMSDFIIYNCFIIWTVTIVLPYNYLVDKVKSVLIEVHSEGGIEKVKFFFIYCYDVHYGTYRNNSKKDI